MPSTASKTKTFSTRSTPWTDDDRRIADVMSPYWANITKTGGLNGPGVPHWHVYNANSPFVMRVGIRFRPVAVVSPERLDFWRRFFASQEQW